MIKSGNIMVAFDSLLKSGIRPEKGSILASSFDDCKQAWKVGIDDAGHPCVLVQPSSTNARKASAIALENLEVQFQVRCKLQHEEGSITTAHYTLLRLTSERISDRTVFFSVCETIADLAGCDPDEVSLHEAIARLVALFRRLLLPPSRTNIGLFGEMVFILEAADTAKAIHAWRNDEYDRHDFSTQDLRIEVKSTSQPQRIHEFSYEQCEIQSGTNSLVASIIVERNAGGITVQQLQDLIEERLIGHFGSLLKLRSVVAETLQTDVVSKSGTTFDLKKARQSLEVYDLQSIPAIREAPQFGVTGVRFKSNLDLCSPIKISDLISGDPSSTSILPKALKP